MMPFAIERAVEVAVLAWVSRPIAAHSASRAFWRMSPVLARIAAATLAVYGVTLAMLAAWSPDWVLRTLTVAALGWIAALEWGAAPSRGRSRGWPSGSLRPFSLAYWFDRDFFIDASRRHGSPFKACQFVRPVACFVGLEEGVRFLEGHEAVLTSPPLPFSRFIPGGFLRFMPRDKHAAMKDLLRAVIAREVYDRHMADVRATFRAELARMAAAPGDVGDAPRPHIQRAVFSAWMPLFFGIAPGTPECARLKPLYKVIDLRNPSGASDRAVSAAGAEIAAMVRASVAARAGHAGEPRSFLAMLAQRRPEALNDDSVVFNLIYLAHTTWADVSGLLQWVFRMLVDHPEWADRLRASLSADVAADVDTMSLSTRIAQETLRLEQSEHLYRVAVDDIIDDRRVIPKGWLVRVCVRESHRDPAVFDRPQVFDPDRFLGRAYTRREYAPFGIGARTACLGEGLSKAFAAAFAEELVRGWRWRTVGDSPYEYSAWRHWRPGSGWRVAATPVA